MADRDFCLVGAGYGVQLLGLGLESFRFCLSLGRGGLCFRRHFVLSRGALDLLLGLLFEVLATVRARRGLLGGFGGGAAIRIR